MRLKILRRAAEKPGMRAVFAGNPNAGKTTLFNAVTHSSLRTGNFHGVTCSASEKTSNGITYVDAPGLYAMTNYSMEEVSAAEEIKKADIIIDVADALTLENSLNLTAKLKSYGKPVVLYVTKLNQLKRRGGSLDAEKLSHYLGIPVFTCPPKQFKKAVEDGINFSVATGKLSFEDCYFAGRESLSRADKLFYNRFFALAFFIAAVAAMFFFAFHPVMPGALLKDLVELAVCDKLCALITGKMQNEALISLLSEGVLGGAGSVLSFLPQLAILYLFLTLLDES